MSWTGLASFKFPVKDCQEQEQALEDSEMALFEQGAALEREEHKKHEDFYRCLLPVGCCACLAHPGHAVIPNYKALAVQNRNTEREVSWEALK